MVFGDGVGYILKEDSLTGFRGCHDESALPFADGREHIDHAGGEVVGCRAAGEVEFLLGEKWSEVLERHAVAHIFRGASVHPDNIGEGEVFLTFAGRGDGAVDHISGLEAECLDLCGCHRDVVGGGEIVEVARAEESVAVLLYLKHAGSFQEAVEVE